jgi:hypothetical protein
MTRFSPPPPQPAIEAIAPRTTISLRSRMHTPEGKRSEAAVPKMLGQLMAREKSGLRISPGKPQKNPAR